LQIQGVLPVDPATLAREDADEMALMLVRMGKDRALHPAKWVDGLAAEMLSEDAEREMEAFL